VLSPCAPPAGALTTLDGRHAPGEIDLPVGAVVRLRHFSVIEQRTGEERQSLHGQPPPGQAALRLRWMSNQPPENAVAQVIDTRLSLLRRLAGDGPAIAAAHGLPDAFARLPGWLNETVPGSRSTIHGDLNLENVLLGPGGMVWLIDFAQTRDGHTLLDFAHLYAELIAHILAPQIPEPAELIALLQAPSGDLGALLQAVEDMAARCLFNPANPHEWELARRLACLGALKYNNLNQQQRDYLYLAGSL
jgi:hypothetical protein